MSQTERGEQGHSRYPLTGGEAPDARGDGGIDQVLLRLERFGLIEVRCNKRQHGVAAVQQRREMANGPVVRHSVRDGVRGFFTGWTPLLRCCVSYGGKATR